MTDHLHPPIVPDLRHALVEGIATRRAQRRRRAVSTLAASALAAVFAAFLLIPTGGDGSRALAVERSSNSTTIRISDPEAGPEAMNEELRAAGIDAEVRFVPATPERIGRWIAIGSFPKGGPIPQREPIPHSPLTDMLRSGAIAIEPPGDLIRIDRSVGQRGDLSEWHLVFYAGRAPRPGEPTGTP